MEELARVTLQNEMDLILAHRRSMRLAELAGLSLPAQTTFATAVSEVARSTIEHGKNGCLILQVSNASREKYLVARISDDDQGGGENEGLAYAKRLVSKYNISTSGKETSIELYFRIPGSIRIDVQKLDEWRGIFRNEPAISPYEAIKRNNEQLQDLTQRLKESENQHTTLTNALPLIIFSLDKKGELIYANDWLRRFTGNSIEQLNKSRWKDVVHPDDYDAFSILINPHLPLGASVIKTQCRLRHRSEKEYYWHLASISPLNDEAGKLLYWTGYIVDINAQKVVEETLQDNRELKETQERLKQQQAALEKNITELNRSNRELQEFAYVASHDLQEPARKLSFYSDFLISKYEDVLDEKGLDYLHNMQSASRRMRTLINDLLAFAQVEREGLKLKHINLNQVTHEVLQDLEMSIEEKGAQVHIEPMPLIEADAGMLHQLFENLLSNAIKYAREDEKPVVKIWAGQEDNVIRIHVEDNGIGFDEKYLPQMFTLFQRLHASGKYTGTGLGLAICQKIVALHQGNITARSKVGAGSTFIVTLPVTQSKSE
ncbi:PAS domain S-box protein [Flavisolibacter sp. BT320]|nr:PAS domain S-box protein [Flavisolibacter longurius]